VAFGQECPTAPPASLGHVPGAHEHVGQPLPAVGVGLAALQARVAGNEPPGRGCLLDVWRAPRERKQALLLFFRRLDGHKHAIQQAVVDQLQPARQNEGDAQPQAAGAEQRAGEAGG
jgi:hypothetical protein